MKKLLLLLMCVLTAVGVRAATTYNMSSSYGTGTLVIDDATGVATVTVTSGTQGHVFGEWFNNLSTASTPTKQEVINAMNDITKMVYSSGSIFSSADFNDVLKWFPTVTTVDATGMKMYSTTGELDIHDLAYVQTLILDEITAAENNYPKVTIDNCDALTTLSLENAFIDYSTTATDVYALAVTNNDNLTSINLDGATIGGSQYGNANLDFSGNTALTTLDLSGVTLRPNAANANINLGTGNAITTLLLPEGVDTSKLSGDVPTIKATYSSSDMVLHVADATDPYTYWYQGTMTAKKNITIDMSNLTAGELSSVLASAQAAGVTYNKVKINGAITASDIKALADVNALVLDLSDATISGSMNANSNVKFLVMPDESTREEVTAAAANFTSLLSAVALWEDASNNRHVVGYNTTAGSLQAAIAATGLCSTNGSNYKRGEKTAYYTTLNQDATLRYVTLAGQMNAYDISGGAGVKLTNGHFVWDKEAIEDSSTANQLSDTRALNGNETVYGALSGGGAVWEIDMEKALFTTISDMTLTSTGILGNPQDSSPGTWKVIIPTDPSVNEIPAWFLGSSGSSNGVKEICIPSNIEIIRTHAFVSVDHIWTTATTGDIDDMVYDNGAWDTTDPDNPIEYKGYTKETLGSTLSFGGSKAEKYGTYTFSSNLKLIETAAFTNSQPHVKDVYVLATTAPECHVDAFNVKMYIGSGGFSPVITDGIITRESYRNGDTWIAMLHYPRDTETPQVQRYVDVTREYTIASNTTDDKGNVVYFPSFSEFLASYTQGTTGYIWTAWDPTRAYGELSNNHQVTSSWSASIQQAANNYVIAANNKNDLAGNPYVAFYDLTANGNLTHPQGVVYYNNVNWNNVKFTTVSPQGNLYPKIGYVEGSGTATTTSPIQLQDADGYPAYEECEDGSVIRDYTMTSAKNGVWVNEVVATPDPNGTKVKEYTFERFNGTPQDGETYYWHSFAKVTNYVYDNYANYYYPTSMDYERDDANGTYVKYKDINPDYSNDGYELISNLRSWGTFTEEQLAAAPHYVGKPSGFVQCATATEAQTKWYNGGNLYEYSDGYAVWSPSDGNTTLYVKVYGKGYIDYDSSRDAADEPRYTIEDHGFRKYQGSADDEYVRYNKTYVPHTYRAPYTTGIYAVADADESPYCPVMGYVYKDQTVNESNDYRGWHQFVLGSYATPTEDIIVNHRSYITDNDWWTICLPYDLNYKEMMLFYGDPKTGKVPYLALLTNVVRDLKDQTITLNFSENLMTHKAWRVNGEWKVSNVAPSQEGDAGDGETVNTENNDIVLHAGVPYLIRPYRIAQEGGSFATQFDIYGQANVNESLSGDWRVTATTTDYPILYNKIAASEQLESYEAMALVEKGIYTVPALVKNKDDRATGVGAENVKSTTLDVKINSVKETLPVSADWDYSFVGNLYYNSFLPQNCYFLGWYNQARFFYADYTLAAVSDMNNKNYKFVNVKLWNNNTCIICPNMLASTVKYHNGSNNGTLTSTTNDETQTYMLGKGKHDGLITPASGSGADARPAQWLIGRTVSNANSTETALKNDWFTGGSAPQHAAAANPALMDFGVMNMSAVTGIEEVKAETKTIPAINDNKVYTIDGRYAGNSIEGLGKGLYILNGKKVVVK